ncbi:unnamed protein product [Peniophora sp. CBMAI 1063]|nr:unnamed protein product [Peniophora sp. CBMAI 1063]
MSTRQSGAASSKGKVSRASISRQKERTKSTGNRKKKVNFDVAEWFRAMTLPPPRIPESELFYRSEFWTPEMDAQVDDRMKVAAALLTVPGNSAASVPSRDAAIAYVAAENLRQSSEMVQVEMQNRRLDQWERDLDEWERDFVEEPSTAEEAEQFIEDLNPVLQMIASYVARRCSGACVWYTAGPNKVYRAKGVCDVPGRTLNFKKEPRVESNFSAQIMRHASIINANKWGNEEGGEPADEVDSADTYEPVVVDEVLETESDEDGDGEKEKGGDSEEGKDRNGKKAADAGDQEMDWLGPNEVSFKPLARKIDSIDDGGEAESASREFVKPRTSVEAGGGGSCGSVRKGKRFIEDLNPVLQMIASYVARRCSGVCVWYTAGPDKVYRAEGVCDLPGRTLKKFSEGKPAVESEFRAQITRHASIINAYKWGNVKDGEPADELDSEDSYEEPVVVDEVSETEPDEGGDGKKEKGEDGEEGKDGNGEKVADAEDQEMDWLGPDQVPVKALARKIDSIDDGGNAESASRKFVKPRTSVEGGGGGSCSRVREGKR